METTVKLAWGALALTHLSPAWVALSPRMVQRLYGLSPKGDIGLLLAHRGALFAAVFLACCLAIFDQPARRALSLVVAISVLGFLLLYLRARAPSGPLRTIAIVDFAALLPLIFVTAEAWGSQAA